MGSISTIQYSQKLSLKNGKSKVKKVIFIQIEILILEKDGIEAVDITHNNTQREIEERTEFFYFL